jgi:hypothetical protein
MRVFALSLCIAAGCTPEDVMSTPDLAPAPDLSAPGCVPEFGSGYFADRLQYLPSDQGFDLNGDGMVDNQTGILASIANQELANAIVNGRSIFVLSVRSLKGPPLVEGDTPTLAFYVAVDGDMPADPSNNAMNGAFRVHREQFDVDCQPTAAFDSKVESGEIRSTAKKVDTVAGGIGTLTFVDVKMTSAPEQPGDYATWTGKIGGVVPVCTLSLSPFPGPNPSSLLDVMVNVFSIQPDIDRDGDGLEKIVGDGNNVKECVTGDGTVIPGRTCPCDPRMQDAYSGAFQFHLVPARIVGLVASTE